jgi:hypothetical protein
MTRQVALIALAVLYTASLALGQNSCPERFRYAGKLSGTGSVAGEFNEVREINLPENASLDTTYQQTVVRSHGGNPIARSDLSAKEIPKGIHIITYGSTDIGKGWSVSAPKLVTIQPPGSAGVTRYTFGMKLHCTVGNAHSQNVGDCNVGVDVCYLPQK